MDNAFHGNPLPSYSREILESFQGSVGKYHLINLLANNNYQRCDCVDRMTINQLPDQAINGLPFVRTMTKNKTCLIMRVP